MKKIVYAGIALMLPFLSALEVRADNPFSNFKPYEQDNTEQSASEASQSKGEGETPLEEGSHFENHKPSE